MCIRDSFFSFQPLFQRSLMNTLDKEIVKLFLVFVLIQEIHCSLDSILNIRIVNKCPKLIDVHFFISLNVTLQREDFTLGCKVLLFLLPFLIR
eukprot:TRINITY_DN8007_c0_g1_i5.p1 TRINITY_DN8007_c0_g1~~TRINITY_DN8007_c0_g1_i5.p1  ORF type:complete len:109 (-),score=11.97 TRINITY_DN8007_c0_g1_i5:92-370(-)